MLIPRKSGGGSYPYPAYIGFGTWKNSELFLLGKYINLERPEKISSLSFIQAPGLKKFGALFHNIGRTTRKKTEISGSGDMDVNKKFLGEPKNKNHVSFFSIWGGDGSEFFFQVPELI